MGIYTDGNVYGVWCFIQNDDGSVTVFIDKKYSDTAIIVLNKTPYTIHITICINSKR